MYNLKCQYWNVCSRNDFYFLLCSESDPSCSQLSSALSVVSGNWRVELIRKIKITQAEVDVLIMPVKCSRIRVQPLPKSKYVIKHLVKQALLRRRPSIGWGIYIAGNNSDLSSKEPQLD